MLVYHGSNSNFRTLRISKSLVRHDSTMTNEGLGIYFSLYKNVAESYGKYLYSLAINDKLILDFTKKSVCTNYLNKLMRYVYNRTKINISMYIDPVNICNYMHYGSISIYGLDREIELQLDSNEKWYMEVSQSNQVKVMQAVRKFLKETLKVYLFTYHIRGVGVIKDVGENVVMIAEKTKC